jgi:competence protein ComEC
MGLVLILGIAIIALSWLPAAASFIGITTIKLVQCFERILEWLQQFNPHSLQLLTLSAVELVCIYIAIACIAIYLLKRQRPALIGGAAALLFLCVLLGLDEWQWCHQRRIVVYSAGKEAWAELIEGKVHYVLCDTAANKKVDYATRSAHIGWHTQSGGHTTDSIFTIGSKSVVLLRNTPQVQTPHHGDYVLIAGADLDVAIIKALYSPKVVILPGRRDQQGFCEECRQNGVTTYEVSQSGAYIIE